MLIRSHDEASDDECNDLLSSHDFGLLIAAGVERPTPVVVPTHFVFDGASTIRLHLAKPNPVWGAIEENPTVVFTVIADWAYISTAMNATPGTDPAYGIPTSYYATVQATCEARVLDDPGEKAALLTDQLATFQPEGGYGTFDDRHAPYARSLPAIRGLELAIIALTGKFKYGGNKPEDHRALIGASLEARQRPGDAAAAAHLARRSQHPS